MAIIHALPGLKANIASQGRVLEEYADNSEWTSDERHDITADKTASCYVECVSNATFRMEFLIEYPFKSESDITFWVDVDGQRLGGSVSSAASIAGGRDAHALWQSRKRISADEVVKRELKFTSIRRSINPPSDSTVTSLTLFS